MNRARTMTAALAAAGILSATAACSGSAQQPPSPTATASATTGTTAASLPATPPGAQAHWLLGAIAHPPIPAAAITAHFDQVFLTKIPAAQLTATLARVAALRPDAVLSSTSEFVVLAVSLNGQPETVTLSVDAHGLINGLGLTASTPRPALTVPATWAAVDKQVQQAAPQTRLLVARVTGGGCQSVNAVDATTPAPLGSAFKLYVLDALARAIAAGTVSWDQRLTLTSQLESLPSGNLATEPAGTQVTVLQAAEDMISSSDNTAADLLLTLVGRTAVEAAAAASGMADPALDTPFLTTRELFVLKLDDWPALASRYLGLSAAGRQAMLTGTVDRIPLSALPVTAPTGWTQPRDIGTLEWFASPADICRVYASLASLSRQPGLTPVAGILEINNGSLALNPRQWSTTWFKGGSEPGVVTLNYLATTRTGQSYVVSVLAANPSAPIPQTSTVLLLGAIKAAFTLAAA
ncbi:MAG TPA: serine hydrolase [Streptosporangiaceae bacterium]|nr:serine hydrolase [Streptosporangiaceae bacterium]